MFKKIVLTLSLLIYPFTQQATTLTPWLEIKPSYFCFTASPMHDIYHKGGFEVQASTTIPAYKYLNLYGSIGYRKAHGYALNTGEKTTLTVVPFDLGLKPIFNFSERFKYFLAIGPRFFYFHQKNQSPYVDPSIKGGGVGLFVNTGFNVLCTEHLLIGFFGEYSYEKKTICPSKPYVYSTGSTQIGGFAVGASFGYAF